MRTQTAIATVAATRSRPFALGTFTGTRIDANPLQATKNQTPAKAFSGESLSRT
jgi:hypothetical protein